ncbi:MAG: twitching motility protein [Candidatus Dojkabacteria bacterium]|nr:MAG: twitching motility protein [Candidatus Dojkabacteria bacterium]
MNDNLNTQNLQQNNQNLGNDSLPVEQKFDNGVRQIQNTDQMASNNMNVQNLVPKEMGLFDILKQAILQEASDIHLSSGYRAILRVDGKLKTLFSQVLTSDQIRNFVIEILGNKRVNLDTIEQLDLSYEFQQNRFRVNIFKELGEFSVVMRLIPKTIQTIEELDLPDSLKQITNLSQGLVLVTGPTGSGKSTTIASLINMINLTQPRHIITLEDPVEYIFPKGMGLVDQREFGIDFSKWTDAIRSTLRQDPDVVLVGEMRDFETIASTITLAETGHLVFATLHTNSSAQAVDRIIDVFPSSQQTQIRAQLANVIEAVVSQRLVPIQGGGRKPAVEILFATSAVRNAIREAKTHQIDNLIQTSQNLGMMTMEQSLVNMVRRGYISVEQAERISLKPDQIKLLLQSS